MEFRWVALITLWTMIAGPMFDSPSAPARAQRASSQAMSGRMQPKVLPVSPRLPCGATCKR